MTEDQSITGVLQNSGTFGLRDDTEQVVCRSVEDRREIGDRTAGSQHRGDAKRLQYLIAQIPQPVCDQFGQRR
ncbi:hypothetical protein ACFY04_34140 [Streptomyces sp. NPDC001549]|uniref:hypothetical protein n=1 Tax=Streptomyces sp. NPDC001549 TaxID=3364586 RepID=UPI0036946D8D